MFTLKRIASKSVGSTRAQMQMRQFNAGFKRSVALTKPMSTTDNFANGTSAVYVDMLYDQWKDDPNSVHASWRSYFNNIEKGEHEPYEMPPSIGRSNKNISLD